MSQQIVAARVPTALIDEFKVRATEDDRTLSSALRQAMRRYLDDAPERAASAPLRSEAALAQDGSAKTRGTARGRDEA